MKNRRAALGDYVDLIYRVAIITITVAIIFGTYVFAFRPSVDVKDSEVVILQKKFYKCFNENFYFDSEKFVNSENNLFESCSINIGSLDDDRYYVKLIHLDQSNNLLKEISSGDSGKGWIESVIQSDEENSWEKYYPSFSNMTYSILNDGKIEKLNIEVWINEI